MAVLNKTLTAVLLLGLLYAFWGTEYFLVKVSVGYIPPFIFAAGNALMAGLLLLAWLRLKGGFNPSRRDIKNTFLAGFLFVFGGSGLIPLAAFYLDSGLVALLSGLSSVMAVTADWLILKNSRPGKLTLAGILLGFLGLAFTIVPALGPEATVSIFGVCMGILSAAMWAGGMLVSKHTRYTIPISARNCLQLIFGGLCLMGTSLVTGEWSGWNAAAVPPHAWAAMAYVCLFAILAGYSCYLWLLNNISLAATSSTAYVCPVIAVVVGVVFGNEQLSIFILMAVVSIALSLIFIANGKSGD